MARGDHDSSSRTDPHMIERHTSHDHDDDVTQDEQSVGTVFSSPYDPFTPLERPDA